MHQPILPRFRADTKIYIQKDNVLSCPDTPGYLAYDNEIARRYETANSLPDDFTIYIVLLYFDEMETYNATNYPLHLQQNDKIYIHFPFHQAQEKRKSFYQELQTILTLIHQYTTQHHNILLWAHKHHDRMIIFIGYYLLHEGASIDYIQDFFSTHNVAQKYINLIQDFASYMNLQHNPDSL